MGGLVFLFKAQRGGVWIVMLPALKRRMGEYTKKLGMSGVCAQPFIINISYCIIIIVYCSTALANNLANNNNKLR